MAKKTVAAKKLSKSAFMKRIAKTPRKGKKVKT